MCQFIFVIQHVRGINHRWKQHKLIQILRHVLFVKSFFSISLVIIHFVLQLSRIMSSFQDPIFSATNFWIYIFFCKWVIHTKSSKEQYVYFQKWYYKRDQNLLTIYITINKRSKSTVSTSFFSSTPRCTYGCHTKFYNSCRCGATYLGLTQN